MRTPPIFHDKLFRECLSLAKNCKTDSRANQAFGSCLVNDGEIVGRGYNRAIVHPSFRLERIVRQGYANHAEVEALNDALMNQRDITNAEVFVVGYFVDSGQIFFQDGFTCLRCANCLDQYQIKKINVPRPNGWKSLSMEEAKVYSRQMPSSGKGDYRKKLAIGKYFLADLPSPIKQQHL